jgi:hypothetical protein
MTDAILKRAMEKRDEALREAERWEEWIKGYLDLSGLPDALDIPMARSAPAQVEATDGFNLASSGINLASSLRDPVLPAEVGNGTTIWPRNGSAN